MGSYSENISKRIAHTKIINGYCLICGGFGKLTQDHVPPKGSITITKVEQRHITEVIGDNSPKVKGITSPNGSKFKTICQKCNNVHLGGNDDEIARVCKNLTLKIKSYFKYANSHYSNVSTDFDAIKFTRAMVGHILAATSVEECKKEPIHSDYFTPLKNFVLGDDSALDETHDIYYWFYPLNKHLSAKCVTFYNEGHISTVSLLSFFPIAFMVTKKNQGTFPAQSFQLSLNDKFIQLDLSGRNQHYAEFPFHGLKDNQMMVLTDYQTIVSYPIGQ